MSNTLKDKILFKRSTEDVITNITSDKILTGEIVLSTNLVRKDFGQRIVTMR